MAPSSQVFWSMAGMTMRFRSGIGPMAPGESRCPWLTSRAYACAGLTQSVV